MKPVTGPGVTVGVGVVVGVGVTVGVDVTVGLLVGVGEVVGVSVSVAVGVSAGVEVAVGTGVGDGGVRASQPAMTIKSSRRKRRAGIGLFPVVCGCGHKHTTRAAFVVARSQGRRRI
jgi:hypothetical protein